MPLSSGLEVRRLRSLGISMHELALESARDEIRRRGIFIANVLPSPTADRTLMLPRMRPASWEQMLNPSPVPPNFLLSPRSPCTNGSKMRCCKFSGMPGPVSCTSNSKVRNLPGGGVGARSMNCANGRSLSGTLAVSGRVTESVASEPLTEPLFREECCRDALECRD